MPASRVALDDTGATLIAKGDRFGNAKTILKNRGPNSAYIDDTDQVDPAGEAWEIEVGEGFDRVLGAGETLYGRAAAGETAELQVYGDD